MRIATEKVEDVKPGDVVILMNRAALVYHVERVPSGLFGHAVLLSLLISNGQEEVKSCDVQFRPSSALKVWR